MGNKVSLEEELINLKLTSRQMQKSSAKCEKNVIASKNKVKVAIQKGNMEGAKIEAQNAIRDKNQALNYLRLASRIDAVSARLETAIRMKQVNKSMERMVKGMRGALKTMDVERISSTMDQFEKQFEDMDVVAGYMENAMGSTTATSMPPDQVDQLIQMVADEHGLEVGQTLDEAGKVGTGVPQRADAEGVDGLAARLADLRK